MQYPIIPPQARPLLLVINSLQPVKTFDCKIIHTMFADRPVHKRCFTRKQDFVVFVLIRVKFALVLINLLTVGMMTMTSVKFLLLDICDCRFCLVINLPASPYSLVLYKWNSLLIRCGNAPTRLLSLKKPSTILIWQKPDKFYPTLHRQKSS